MQLHGTRGSAQAPCSLEHISILLALIALLCGCSSARRARTEESHERALTALEHRALAAPLKQLSPGLGTRVDGGQPISAIVRRIFEDSRGRLWIGSQDEGVFVHEGEALTRLSSADGLAGNQVTGILEDQSGRIWLSTNGGVSRFDGHAFTSFGREHGLSSAQVWSLFEARDGTIWAGTAAGPCRLDGKRFVALELPRFPEGGAPRAVWCLAQDREGALWFGTDQGICIQRPAGFGFVTTSNALGHDSATSIAFAADGATWCGSMSSGLSRSDERSVVCFRAPEDIGGNEVWSVALDQRGAAWFTCEGHGVYRCEGATLSNFSTAQGLDVLAPQSIHQDRAGRIWVGGGGGLYRLEGERFVHVQRNGPWR